MNRVVTVAARGLADVIARPLLVVGAVAITFAAAAPFAVIVGNQLEEALANQPPIALGSGEIDADWWSEFRLHAEGLAATFTPTVIGFAAPLDNLSAILDGTRRPLPLLAPVVVAMVAWAWYWGVVLTRFHGHRPRGFRNAVAAGLGHLPRFLTISIAAALVQIVLYLTVHPLLFTAIYERMIGAATPESTAFAIRVVFYVIFGLLIMTVSLVADYARVADVVDRPAGVGGAIRRGAGFVREHYSTVLALFAATGVLFVLLLVTYGAVDVYGGARVGGWRGIALAQAYIVARLVIRLTVAASEVRLFAASSR